MVMGSEGTMIVSQEKEILLYKEAGNSSLSRSTSVTVEGQGKKPLETSPSLAGAYGGDGAWAHWPRPSHRAAIAKSSSTSPTACDTAITRIITTTRITSRAAGARLRWRDAIIALTSNMAMRQNRRIDFDPRWFDYKSPETPERSPAIARSNVTAWLSFVFAGEQTSHKCSHETKNDRRERIAYMIIMDQRLSTLISRWIDVGQEEMEPQIRQLSWYPTHGADFLIREKPDDQAHKAGRRKSCPGCANRALAGAGSACRDRYGNDRQAEGRTRPERI